MPSPNTTGATPRKVAPVNKPYLVVESDQPSGSESSPSASVELVPPSTNGTDSPVDPPLSPDLPGLLGLAGRLVAGEPLSEALGLSGGDMGKVVHLLEDHGHRDVAAALLDAHVAHAALGNVDVLLADGHRATESGNADRFVKAYKNQVRWVAAWNKWVVYEHGVWKVDFNSALATELARDIPRAMFTLAADQDDRDKRDALIKWAKASEKSSAIQAMLTLARGVEGIRTNHEVFDADPWLFNVRNGTIDLRTGGSNSMIPMTCLRCKRWWTLTLMLWLHCG